MRHPEPLGPPPPVLPPATSGRPLSGRRPAPPHHVGEGERGGGTEDAGGDDDDEVGPGVRTAAVGGDGLVAKAVVAVEGFGVELVAKRSGDGAV